MRRPRLPRLPRLPGLPGLPGLSVAVGVLLTGAGLAACDAGSVDEPDATPQAKDPRTLVRDAATTVLERLVTDLDGTLHSASGSYAGCSESATGKVDAVRYAVRGRVDPGPGAPTPLLTVAEAALAAADLTVEPERDIPGGRSRGGRADDHDLRRGRRFRSRCWASTRRPRPATSSPSSIDSDGSLDAINVLHGASAGFVEWSGGGNALLRPRILFDGVEVSTAALRWRRLDRWIPVFTVDLPDGSTLTGTICAPGGYPPARGFIVRFEADNRGRIARELRVELDVEWTWTRLWIATARPLPGNNLLTADEAGTALTLETDGGRGPALAIGTSRPPELFAARGAIEPAPLRGGSSIVADNGTTLRARVSQASATCMAGALA